MRTHIFLSTCQIGHQELYLPNTPSHYTPSWFSASYFFACFSCLILLLTILANLTSSSVYQPGCSFARLMIVFAAFLSFNVLYVLYPKDYLVQFILLSQLYLTIRRRICNTSKNKSCFQLIIIKEGLFWLIYCSF